MATASAVEEFLNAHLAMGILCIPPFDCREVLPQTQRLAEAATLPARWFLHAHQTGSRMAPIIQCESCLGLVLAACNALLARLYGPCNARLQCTATVNVQNSRNFPIKIRLHDSADTSFEVINILLLLLLKLVPHCVRLGHRKAQLSVE